MDPNEPFHFRLIIPDVSIVPIVSAYLLVIDGYAGYEGVASFLARYQTIK